ncbi:MAG: hypothetical protein OXH49_08130 [Gemmatimonadetes bacterium]|nr:hypothetical protein [Gemmatimonadota bacterium]
MTRCHRPAIVGIAGVSLLAVVGCAASPVPAPDIVTLLPYNGEWPVESIMPAFVYARNTGS